MPLNTDTNIVSSALPSGAATAAKQDTGNATLAQISGQIPTTLDANGRLKVGQGTGTWTVVSYVTLVGAGTLTTTVDLSDYENALILVKNGMTASSSFTFSYEDPVVGSLPLGNMTINAGQSLPPNMAGILPASSAFAGTKSLNVQYGKIAIPCNASNAGSYIKVIGWRRS